jgi:hypothetical protein
VQMCQRGSIFTIDDGLHDRDGGFAHLAVHAGRQGLRKAAT